MTKTEVDPKTNRPPKITKVDSDVEDTPIRSLLLERRLALNLSQAAAAELIGMNRVSYAKMESGVLSVSRYHEVADALQVSEDELYYAQGQLPPHVAEYISMHPQAGKKLTKAAASAGFVRET